MLDGKEKRKFSETKEKSLKGYDSLRTIINNALHSKISMGITFSFLIKRTDHMVFSY